MNPELADIDSLSPAKRALYQRLLKSRIASDKQTRVTGKTVGELILTPTQRDEFEIVNPDRHIFNMPLLLKTRCCLPVDMLEKIVSAVLEHHDGLRLVSSQREEQWTQRIAGMPDGLPVQHHDLSSIEDDDELTRVLEKHVADIQQSFVLDQGPLLKVAQFDCGELRGSRLLIIAHHMACDQHSANIVLQDMGLALHQLQQGGDIKLPKKTTSLIDWAQSLADYAHDDRVSAQHEYWNSVCSRPFRRIPTDMNAVENVGAYVSARTLEVDQSPLTGLQHALLRKAGIQLQSVFVTACAQSLANWKGDDNVCLSMLHHGRTHPFPDVDLSRTVGWFSYQYPMALYLDARLSKIEQASQVQQQMLEVPDNGMAYGLLRHFVSPDMRKTALSPPTMDMFLNIQLGCEAMKHDFFDMAQESTGRSDSLTIQRPIPLYLNMHARDDVIFMHCAFNTRIHHAETIDWLLSDIGTRIADISQSIELQQSGV